jgi:pimeloyl-ACP methyl ester carboxylesterase
VLIIDTEDADAAGKPNGQAWWKSLVSDDDAVVVCQPRGYGATKWTRKNPPNYVERAHALLGTTVDMGRVRDAIAAARWMKKKGDRGEGIHLIGKEAGAVLAAYAAIFEPEDIASVELIDPPTTHEDADAPQFLSVLRIVDVPAALALIAPRPVTLHTPQGDADRIWNVARQGYRAAEAADGLKTIHK